MVFYSMYFPLFRKIIEHLFHVFPVIFKCGSALICQMKHYTGFLFRNSFSISRYPAVLSLLMYEERFRAFYNIQICHDDKPCRFIDQEANYASLVLPAVIRFVCSHATSPFCRDRGHSQETNKYSRKPFLKCRFQYLFSRPFILTPCIILSDIPHI